ncbi:MAG TPA: two-component regulator propeller domain-containing protein [Thermoanaerobaculia bacterium]|nr:two-component regulator propeller domain-containing protein [Thermoanaerobaculia bacterium]
MKPAAGPVLLLLALYLAAPADAQVRIHRNLAVEDGLAQSQVLAIHEDHDGYLWFATNDGVSRFDGAGFTSLQSREGLPAGPVYAVGEARGALFFGTDRGVAVYEKGRLTAPDAKSGLGEGPVRAIASDKNGRLFFGRLHSIVASHPEGRYETIPLSTQKHVTALLVARDGTLYAGTMGDGLFAYRDGKSRQLGLAGNLVNALCEARDGTVWIGTESGLAAFRDGTLRSQPGPAVLAIREGADGTLYLGTAASGVLLARRGTGEVFDSITQENGLAWNRVPAIYETRGGAVYLGTDRGVSVYDRGRIESWTPDITGLSDGVVWSIAEDRQGGVWLGTGQGLAVRRGDRWERVGRSVGLPDETVRVLHVGPSGRLYAGTQLGGAAVWDGTRFRSLDGLPDPFVRALYEAPDGSVFIGTNHGVAILRDGRTEVPAGLGQLSINSIAGGPQGAVWLATLNGLVLYENGRFRTWAEKDGLADDRVWSVRVGRDGMVYAGTASGLSVLRDGRFETFDTRQGLTNDTVYCLLEDDAGRIYASTNRGVNVLDVHHRPVHVRTLTRDDGLASNEGNLGACYRDAAGRLWFGTVQGASVYDPRREVEEPGPPRVHVTGLRLFDEELPATAGGERSFDSQENFFAFSFAGIDLAAPHRVVYRYRLAGLDRRWIETDRRSVQYTNLDPGSYRFEVQASSGGGVWSEPAALSFRILTPLWRRGWFLALIALAIGSVVFWTVRTRVRQLLAIERLRTSLAADLHDHIGAGLTEIAILSEIAAYRTGGGTGGAAAPELGKMAEIARRLVDQMNDIVWLVNPRRDSLHELFLRLKDSYAELFSHAGVLFRTTNLLLFEHVHLPMDYRENLYLIFKEALHNSLRHSGCSEIELAVAVRGRRLEVILKDDGRGFDTAGADGGNGGNGLGNMRRRASRIGGVLAIDSAPQQGTAISFSGPLASS